MTDKRILAAEAKVAKAQERADAVLAAVQFECTHEEVVACDYKPLEYFAPLLPVFVCTNCGVHESGWAAYQIRKKPISFSDVGHVAREVVYGLRRGKER